MVQSESEEAMSRPVTWVLALALAIGMSYTPDGPTESDAAQAVADDLAQAPIDALIAQKE